MLANNLYAGGIEVTSPTKTGAPSNPALAQEDGTYRCVALPTGGLGPLPRRKESFALANDPNTGSGITYVSGMATLGYITASGTEVGNTDQAHRTEVHLALNWYENDIPDVGETFVGDREYFRWVRETLFNTTPDTEVIVAEVQHAEGSIRSTRFTPILRTRLNPSAPIEPGPPVVIMSWTSTRLDAWCHRAFPDPDNPTTNSSVVVGDPAEDENYTLALVHQNRVVFAKFIPYSHGLNSSITTNENLLWTNANDIDLSTTTPSVFLPELDGLVSDMGSMTANELLVVKRLGGGYIISGDLDDPTIIQLPNLASPDGSDTVRGCNTSLGYVYSAGDSGIYVWSGGDDAEHLSPQLTGSFATSLPNSESPYTMDGHNGQMDRWMDMVLVPRNWVYDTRTRGWWRIEDPADMLIRFWSTSSHGRQTFGAERSFTSESPEFLHMYDYSDRAYSWSWKSHPMWVSQDREFNTRQLICSLSGYGRVTFTFINELGDTDSHTFTIAHDNIRNYRCNIALRSQNLIMQIEAEGYTIEVIETVETEVPAVAPMMHRCFVGIDPRSHLTLSTDTGV